MTRREIDFGDDLNRFETPEEALQYLRYCGTLDDAAIDVGEAALALALLFQSGLNPDRYRQHLKKLGNHVAEEFAARQRQGAEDSLALRLAVLRKVIHEAHQYEGDDQSYDDLQNASIIRVIERRKGLPVALGILYIVAARKQGWMIDGLNFPGHFLLRMDMGGERIIVDPFRGGVEMNAADLRSLLKTIAGKNAELSHHFYDPVSSRDVLLRLENNLKKRLIDGEDYAQAIVVLEAMAALAPAEHRILFDKGILYAKLGQGAQAAGALEDYIQKAPDARDRQQAKQLLAEIRARMT